MSSEATPLIESLKTAGKKTMEQLASQEAKQKAKEFASASIETLKELGRKANDGNTSIRTLAVLGGIAMIFTSVQGILGHIFLLKPISALMDIYTALFGAAALAFELDKDVVPAGLQFDRYIAKNFHLMEYVTGRGILYIFAGTLKMSQGSIISYAVGGFMAFVGVVYVIVGRRTFESLRQAERAVFTESQLKSKFTKVDKDKSNYIDQEEFRDLVVNELGLKLNVRETELAFMMMDKNADQRITFDEFKKFWDNPESQSALLV